MRPRARALRRRLTLGVLALAWLVPATARAQSTDPAAAAELFHEGRSAMAEGSYELACAKFSESQRLDARVGTLINLALCEEALGRVATARGYWGQATDLARATADARATFTTERFEAIDRRAPRLTVRLGASAPPGTIVRRDSVDLGAASLGTPLPVDPGRHTVVAVAPQRADGPVAVVELREGETKEITVEPAAAPLPEPRPATVEPVAPGPAARPTSSALRVAAIASGAAGVLGLGLGAYFGVEALGGQSGSPGVCHGAICDSEGATVRRSAIQAADASTAAFIAGGALAAAGVVLWVVAPPRTRGRPSVGVAPTVEGHGAGVGIRASF